MEVESETTVNLLTTVSTKSNNLNTITPSLRTTTTTIIGPEIVARYIESHLSSSSYSKEGDLKHIMSEAKTKEEVSGNDKQFIDNMVASMRMAVRKPPEVALGRYLAKFRGFYPPEYSRSVWVVTTLYFTRLRSLPGFHLFRGNVHFVSLVALTLALKYLIDNCPHSIYFAHVGGVSFEEHRYLEGVALRLLDFRLYFDQATFCCMLGNLETFNINRLRTNGERNLRGTKDEFGRERECGKAVGKKMMDFFKGKMCCISNHKEIKEVC